MAKVYICTGGCNGVSEVAKNCGAIDCPHLNQPLEPREQCDSCVNKTKQEGADLRLRCV